MMKKYLPILLSLLTVALLFYVAVTQKNNKRNNNVNVIKSVDIKNTKAEQKKTNSYSLGAFTRQANCMRSPQFLRRLKIPQPVMIDLSQKRYKGVAIHYGNKFQQTMHPKTWEKYAYFSTYTLDTQGNIYLIPAPFISVQSDTFELQKNIYKVGSQSSELEIFMSFDEVKASSNNPYGLNAITFDCDDKTLWASSIDQSTYQSENGVIYHINPETKKVLQKVEGFDVLTMQLINTKKGKHLLVGSARDNGLYAYKVTQGKLSKVPEKLLELPSANEHIKKVKIKAKNHLELQTIPFSYSLIAQSSKKDRGIYDARWNEANNKWELTKRL